MAKTARSQRKWINYILLDLDDVKKRMDKLEETVKLIREDLDKLIQVKK